MTREEIIKRLFVIESKCKNQISFQPYDLGKSAMPKYIKDLTIAETLLRAVVQGAPVHEECEDLVYRVFAEVRDLLREREEMQRELTELKQKLAMSEGCLKYYHESDSRYEILLKRISQVGRGGSAESPKGMRERIALMIQIANEIY